MQESSKDVYFAKKLTRWLQQLCMASYTMNFKQTGSVSDTRTRDVCLCASSTYPSVGSVQDLTSMSCTELYQIIFTNPWQWINFTPLSAFINKCLSLIWCAYLTPTPINDRTFEQTNAMMWGIYCQEGEPGRLRKLIPFWLSDLRLANFADRLFATMSFGGVANLLCIPAGSEADAAAFQQDAGCFSSSGIWWAHVSLIGKEWLLERPVDKTPLSLSTLKRKGKIIPLLVLEENSNMRSNKIIVGLFSFLICISNMGYSQRDKTTTLRHLYVAPFNITLRTCPTSSDI